MNRAPSGAPSTTEQAPFSASPQSLLGRRYERAARGEPAAGDGTACAPRPGPANTVGGRPPSWLWLSAGVVVFSAALLSFQVQPLVARYLLPRFGGGSSVWTVCLLFFQTTLMLGYAYAHWMSRRLTLRWQLRLHAALLLASLALLPVLPRAGFEPDPARDPTASLLLFLVRHLGLPFLLLSGTSPLVQSWCGRVRGDAVYRLYGLSNLGSFLGLLSYPFLLEPCLGLQAQSRLWTAAFAAFVLASIVFSKACAQLPAATPVAPAGDELPVEHRPARARLAWFVLPACASVLLFATTSRMTQDIAPVPLLWVLPLGLYLLAFLLAFSGGRDYARPVWIPLAALGLAGAVRLMRLEQAGEDPGTWTPLLVHAAALFTCCRVLFGELVRERPDVRDLTSFYLRVAAGGAAGGCFVALVAPRIFDDYWELHLAYLSIALSVGVCLLRSTRRRRRRELAAALAGGLGLALLAWALLAQVCAARDGVLLQRRSFHGVLTVTEESPGSRDHKFSLYHGRICHGDQYVRFSRRTEPTTYFIRTSGVGLALLQHPRRAAGVAPESSGAGPGLRVGAVGLGVGTVAAYGRAGDDFRFYELDPAVLQVARSHFHYLRDTPARVEVVLGDARVSLERELRAGGPQHFDVLVVDAFSGDSIPIHLLTREAFKLYWSHLRPDGILAVHTSNRYLELAPVVRALAEERDLRCAVVEAGAEFPSQWVLVTRSEAFLELPDVRDRVRPRAAAPDRRRAWTDDHSSLLRALSLGG